MKKLILSMFLLVACDQGCPDSIAACQRACNEGGGYMAIYHPKEGCVCGRKP